MNREQAFCDFAKARTPALYRSAMLLCGDRHLTEDLVQETLAKVYLAWDKRAIDNPAGYAQTTLVRTFISSRRLRSSHERPSETLPEDSTVQRDVGLRVDLLNALRRLSPTDRAVLVLRFLEDQSVQQTADILAISPGAVRNRTLRALARARDLLGTESSCLGGIG